MFENDKVSSVQMMRMLVLGTLGISLLCTTEIGIFFGERDGLFCILVGYLFSLFYAGIVFGLIKKKGHLTEAERKERKRGRLTQRILAFVFILKYCFLLVPVLCLFLQLARTALVPQRPVWLVLGSCLLICLFLAKQGIEAIGRLAQCLYVLVLIACVVPVICLFPQADAFYSAPLYVAGVRSVLKGGFWILFLLFPLELLLFGSEHFDSHEELSAFSKRCYKGISLVFLINGIYYVTNVGVLSINGILQESDVPACLQLLNRLRISNFLLVFFLISVCFTVGILLYSILQLFQYLLPKVLYRQPKICRRILTGIVAVAVFSLVMCTFYLAPEYETARFVSENRSNIEHRIYANAVILSRDEKRDEYQMSLVFPHDNDGTSVTRELHGTSLSDLIPEFARSGNKQLDFSHTEVLLLDGSIYEEAAYFQETVAYLNSLDKLSHRTLICGIENPAEDFLKMNESLDVALGEYLRRLTETNLSFADTTLESLKKVNIESEPACMIALFSVADERPYYSGAVILNQQGAVNSYQDAQAAIMHMIYGKHGLLIPFGPHHQYRIDSNDFMISNSVDENGAVTMKVIYSGMVTPIKQKDLSESDFNQLASILLRKQLVWLLEEKNCDLLNIYKHLSIDAPKVYTKYLNNQERFYQKCTFDIECRYRFGAK